MTSTVCGTGATKADLGDPLEAGARQHALRAAAGLEQSELAADLLLRDRAGDDAEADLFGVAAAAAEIVGECALEPDWTKERARRLVRAVSLMAEVDESVARTATCSIALRDPRVHELAPAVAAVAVLRILHTVGPVRGAALWGRADGRRIRRIAGVADASIRAEAGGAAQELLTSGAGSRREETTLLSLPVTQWERTTAALVVEPECGQERRARALAEEAALTLAVVLQRDLLLTRGAERERQLAQAGDRRLTRLGCDIHDGPLQDLAVIGIDIATLRAQLTTILGDRPERGLAIERLETILKRLVGVESEMRQLSASLESNGIGDRPLRESLERHVVDLEAQQGLRAELHMQGDVTDVTPSQRIALTRVVQESLRNAADHGHARTATVRLESGRNGIRLEIRDEGRGFDGDAELVDAARRGRLGVVSMSERVRLLGGHFDIESRRGGPTIVSVQLPWWRPLETRHQNEPAARAAR